MKKSVFLILLVIGCRPSNQIGELVGAIQQRSLEETVWTARQLYGKEISVSNAEKAPYFKLLTDGQKLHGFGGCNSLTGSYKKEGNRISAQIAATRMYCEGKMDIEQSMLKVLGTTSSYSIKEDVLTLKADGKVVAVFKAEPEKMY
jgi:heat shock protein HslJ